MLALLLVAPACAGGGSSQATIDDIVARWPTDQVSLELCLDGSKPPCRYDGLDWKFLGADHIRSHWSGAGFLVLATKPGGFDPVEAPKTYFGTFLENLADELGKIYEPLGPKGGLILRDDADDMAHIAFVEDGVLIMVAAMRPQDVDPLVRSLIR